MAAAGIMVGLDLAQLRDGQAVIINAKDEFFTYVDGWHGRFRGVNNGLAVVECARVDGTKTFFVPADELALSVG